MKLTPYVTVMNVFPTTLIVIYIA